ncbi:MAG: alpha/beta fold hydrolase, partial [Opitutaceae bacterium]
MPNLTASDGGDLHYTEQGAGPLTIVYLHGMGGETGVWDGLWRHLGRQRFRHIALDFRGHG